MERIGERDLFVCSVLVFVYPKAILAATLWIQVIWRQRAPVKAGTMAGPALPKIEFLVAVDPQCSQPCTSPSVGRGVGSGMAAEFTLVSLYTVGTEGRMVGGADKGGVQLE